MRSDKPILALHPHVTWHAQQVTRPMRESRNGHRSMVVWFTGLPSSGKSTLAHGVEECLFAAGLQTYVLDGDNVRHGLCRDLGFSDRDRSENIRRIAETAKLLIDAGIIALAAFVSPSEAGRRRVRELVGPENFVEVYCRCPADVCAARDPKGNYAKAKAGAITQFTGVSAPYEAPSNPDLTLDTDQTAVGDGIDAVLALLRQRGAFDLD